MQHYIGREELNAFTCLLRSTILCQSAFKLRSPHPIRSFGQILVAQKVGGVNADD